MDEAGTLNSKWYLDSAIPVWKMELFSINTKMGLGHCHWTLLYEGRWQNYKNVLLLSFQTVEPGQLTVPQRCHFVLPVMLLPYSFCGQHHMRSKSHSWKYLHLLLSKESHALQGELNRLSLLEEIATLKPTIYFLKSGNIIHQGTSKRESKNLFCSKIFEVHTLLFDDLFEG